MNLLIFLLPFEQPWYFGVVQFVNTMIFNYKLRFLFYPGVTLLTESESTLIYKWSKRIPMLTTNILERKMKK